MRRVLALIVAIGLLVAVLLIANGTRDPDPGRGPEPPFRPGAAGPAGPPREPGGLPPALHDPSSGPEAGSSRESAPGSQPGTLEVDEEGGFEILEHGIGNQPNSITLDGDRIHLDDALIGARVTVTLFRRDTGAWHGESTLHPGTVEESLGEPPGLYRVEVAAEKDGLLVRAKSWMVVGRRPEDGNLPDIHLAPGAGVRARVVDAAGTPVPQARVVVVRPEEVERGLREVEPGKDGWVHVADLEPGVDHRVITLGLPRPVERVVRVPPGPKGTAEVEIRWPEKLVPVKLRFFAEDEERGLRMLQGDVAVRMPATGRRWEKATSLGPALLPGTYVFEAAGRRATVTVSANRPLNAYVILRPPGE